MFCKQRHHSYKCSNIRDVNKRKDILRRDGRCFVCTRKGHVARNCHVNYKCIKCEQRHHVSICDKDNRDNNITRDLSDENQLTLHVNSQNSSVLLQSAIAQLLNTDESQFNTECRILFDSCSQRTYVTKNLCEKLNLKPVRKETVVLKRFASDDRVLKTLDVVQICVKGQTRAINVYIDALCIPFICSHLEKHNLDLIQEQYTHLRGLTLAENPRDIENREVDILLGLDYYYSFFSGKTVKGRTYSPVALDSCLGYVICGPITKQNASANLSSNNVNTFLTMKLETEIFDRHCDNKLHNDLSRYFIDSSGYVEEDDNELYDQFKRDIKFDGARYHTKLPFKPDSEVVSDNYDLSLSRLKSLKRRLDTDENLRMDYSNIITEYQNDGIIEQVFDNGIKGNVSYLPHHPVVREDKATTKTRIVFDGSAKAEGGKSLND